MPFALADELRPLYHAAAVFASNSLVTVSAIAESLFEAAGVPDPERRWPAAARDPRPRRALGAARALTGPALRGDAGTSEGTRSAGAARSRPRLVYVVLARSTLQLAERSGRASPAARGAVEDVLAGWT